MLTPRISRHRAFVGLAGSPLSVVHEPTPQAVKPSDLKSKRGRPRKYANDAARMRHNRAKERENEEIAEVLTHDPEGPFVMKDAPHGRGLLVSGGFDSAKISEVIGAREREGYTEEDVIFETKPGHKVRPQGLGGVEDDDSRDSRAEQSEAEDKFVRKQERAFKRPSDVLPVARWKRVRMLCPVHPGDPEAKKATWDKAIGKFVLECGCHRDLDIQKGINEQPISEKCCS